MTEGQIMGGAERLGRFVHWYASVKQGVKPKHRLIEMITGDATVDYPSSALADRNQD